MESKNKAKRSLFTCLKPATCIMDVLPSSAPVLKRSARDPVLSYLAVADKHGAVLPAMLSSMFGVGDMCGIRRRKWKAIRSALNETSLMSLVVKRRKANKNRLSMSSRSMNKENTETISFPKPKSGYGTRSNVASSICSSSSRASYRLTPSVSSPSTGHVSSFSTQQALARQKQRGMEDKKLLYDSTLALCCLFSFSLLILIVWGKFIAILFTSLWLYLVPLCGRMRCNEGDWREGSELEIAKSNNTKKVVIYGIGD
ncbi:uncharacterized protein LOC106780305 [Vigna radiata var. radiata]|uniref:Uncharacterized protein LOC106780305 n=1 Tax=Vigna radiata var. radiata TaxID=3916 RepID=A0A1S3W0S6_VIGRR|nr:uncharacterized protein LOC106780305 [Vigna radiata var. radiata]